MQTLTKKDCQEVFDPPILLSDDSIFEVEPFKYTGTNGEPLNIYQLIKECGYDDEEARIILDQYCDRMDYDELRRKKVFLEWSVY